MFADNAHKGVNVFDAEFDLMPPTSAARDALPVNPDDAINVVEGSIQTLNKLAFSAGIRDKDINQNCKPLLVVPHGTYHNR